VEWLHIIHPIKSRIHLYWLPFWGSNVNIAIQYATSTTKFANALRSGWGTCATSGAIGMWHVACGNTNRNSSLKSGFFVALLE
jgi:hypothetical protein